MISNLDKRVIEELEKRGLTPEDLKKNYKYCGGNQGRHLEQRAFKIRVALNKLSKNLFCIKCNKWKCRCK
jgi:hypothetical protein